MPLKKPTDARAQKLKKAQRELTHTEKNMDIFKLIPIK